MYTNVTVQQILERKGYDVWSVEPNVSVFDALRFMAGKNIGAVVVIDDYGFKGFESQHDMWNAFAAEHGQIIANLPTGQGLLIKA